MTDVVSMEAYAGQLSEAAAKATAVAAIQHQVAHGDEQTDVLTESGLVPSLAKQAVLSQKKVAAALEDVAVQMAGAMVYATIAQGLAASVNGGYFSVPSEQSTQYINLYRNSNGTALLIKTYPSVQALDAIGKMLSQVVTTAVEQELLFIADGDQEARMVELTDKRFSTPAFDIRGDSNATVIGDGEGAVTLYSDDRRTIVGPLEIQATDLPGLFSVDGEGALLMPSLLEQAGEASEQPLSPFASGLMFAPTIATAEIYDTPVYVRNMIPERTRADEVLANVASTTTDAIESGECLKLSAARFGAAAVLKLRERSVDSTSRIMPLKLVNVPVQNPVVPVKILIIGDSIANRQGGQFLRQFLELLGFAPTFIGTLPGSAKSNTANDTSGELGEAREGWETGDFTNAITDRVIVVQPGEEAAYQSMSKPDKWPRNPFLRAAVESDSADIVRNGYVFDPAFYQARFALPTPDVVINALGTNDVRDRAAGSIYDVVLANDTLMHNQIRSAWPNAKIIRTFPGTAYESFRNEQWLRKYLPMLRAIQQSAADRGDSKLVIAPLWAMTDPEGGYAYPAGQTGLDGFRDINWSDAIHPIGAARINLYKAFAPYVAAAALNLI